MTQHINPGVDTTIKCCHYDVCYMIHAHNKCINDKPTEIPCIFDSRKEINFSRCALHTPVHPPETRQRINAATLKALINWLNEYEDDVTFSRSLLKSKIALLQAGRK